MINLKEWEFVSFVKGNFEEADLCKQIMLLVKNREMNKMKLLMIFIDPWKDIYNDEIFDVPENIFFVKNSNILFPRSTDDREKKLPFCMYTSDKIKSVHIIPQDGNKER